MCCYFLYNVFPFADIVFVVRERSRELLQSKHQLGFLNFDNNILRSRRNCKPVIRQKPKKKKKK